MNDPLNIAICEDTRADEEKLLDILSACPIPTNSIVFHSGEALLEAYEPQKFDLLLMDIYMGGITGVETIARIRQTDPEVPVAFVTTSTDHTLESYRLSVLKYIEKPYNDRDILSILKLAKLTRDSAPAITIRKNGQEEKIRISRILYLEQQTHQLSIFLKNGCEIQVYDKLSLFLPQLEEQGFFVPHKSFAVNLSYVRFIDPELRCFMMQNGKNIPIRRESMGKAKQALKDYLFDMTRREGHE